MQRCFPIGETGELRLSASQSGTGDEGRRSDWTKRAPSVSEPYSCSHPPEAGKFLNWALAFPACLLSALLLVSNALPAWR